MKDERTASVLQECNLQSANNKLLIVVSALAQRSKKDNFLVAKFFFTHIEAKFEHLFAQKRSASNLKCNSSPPSGNKVVGVYKRSMDHWTIGH